MEIPGWNNLGGLRDQISDLERIMNGGQSRMNPDAQVVKAATDLYLKIKTWPEADRKMIDALYPKISGELGDFMIELDRILRSIGKLE